MDARDKINPFDLVKVIQVPDELAGVIDVGDIGIVVEKLDEQNFEVECVTPDGSFKWLEKLNIRYLSKHLQPGRRATWNRDPLLRPSVLLGSALGTTFGGLVGAGLGAITRNLSGMLVGLGIGLLLGLVTGAVTAALTVRTAGTTGGVGIGYYTGMLFGGLFGMAVGALAPASLRLRAHTEGLPVLDALALGRFETAIFLGFFLSILGTIIGVWIGGKNHVLRKDRE